ncbi:hypothetical protein ACFLIM_09525 [Nonomuraea sp. M3C6]|uniref:PPE family protein n=1 Tax=Nonomuraea marmarensis TaxID=3351344 RepID=A0ABW7A8R3_9ACTN
MAERTVDIRDPDYEPKVECVTESREQIQAWLEATSPLEVQDRGLTYGRVAGAIRAVAEALPEIGTVLQGAWRSTNSAQAQRALRMLNTSGVELAAAMDKVSGALTSYGEVDLPNAIDAVRHASEGPTPEPSPGPSPASSAEPTVQPTIGSQPSPGPSSQPSPGSSTAASEADRKARQAMQDLNSRIAVLYRSIPASVTIDLPEVSPAGGPAPERPLPLREQASYREGDYWNGGGSGSSGGGSHAGGGGAGGSGSSGGPEGSRGPDGGSGDDSGHDSGTGTDDRPGTDPPGASDDQGGSSSTDQRDQDGTTPPVIDNSTPDEDRTTRTPGDTQDPRGTEAASTPVNPPAHTPTTGYTTPPAGTPAVIGGGGSYSQPGVAAAAASRAGVNGMGMPFMPMGGAAGGEQEQDHERSTYLTEDRDMWKPGESATSPVIGA